MEHNRDEHHRFPYCGNQYKSGDTYILAIVHRTHGNTLGTCTCTDFGQDLKTLHEVFGQFVQTSIRYGYNRQSMESARHGHRFGKSYDEFASSITCAYYRVLVGEDGECRAVESLFVDLSKEEKYKFVENPKLW